MPEPTRQSLSGCCSQPEHGPTLSHQMSQGRKKNVARPGLEPRVSRLPCEHSTTELPSHSIDRLQKYLCLLHGQVFVMLVISPISVTSLSLSQESHFQTPRHCKKPVGQLAGSRKTAHSSCSSNSLLWTVSGTLCSAVFYVPFLSCHSGDS